MITLKIDSAQCDMAEDQGFEENALKYDLNSLSDPENAETGRSVTFALPSTPDNDAITGYAADPCRAQLFNASYHEGVVEVDGVELLRGVAHLTGVKSHSIAGAAIDSREVVYMVRITEGGGDWAELAARTAIADTPIDYERTLSADLIEQSWQGTEPVVFLPVHRDEYRTAYSQASLYPPQRIMTVADFHPFISLKALIGAVFTEAGYTLTSGFLNGELFGKLYMSGRYPSVSSSRLQNTMGFRAGRVSEPSAVADIFGRVYLSPLVLTSTLGNIVETFDNADAATQGEQYYNNNGVLAIDGNGVRFTPLTTVTAGFELLLKYTTDYSILTRERLKGFDSIYVDSGCDIKFSLANRFEDRRTAPQPNTSYLCIVFGHTAGNSYRVVCRYASTSTIIATFSTRSATATLPLAAENATCELQQLQSDGSYAAYAGDWALYDGYIGETGVTEVEVTLQTPPERLTPTSPKLFTRMYLHGAAKGQNVTLSKYCRLTPLFSLLPAEGSALTFADVAAYQNSRMNLLKAVQQMFNLRLYTDPKRKRVYVEPYDDFFRTDEHDWSERIDLSQAIEATDMAADTRKTRRLTYLAEQGGAVTRLNNQTGTVLGQWSYTSPSYVSLQGTQRIANALFCPTLNTIGVYAAAPSASVVDVGDRDADDGGDALPRVICYQGMQPLPEGERWEYPSITQNYPFAAFHSAEAFLPQFTLCFEDRDGQAGLHVRYDKQWQTEAFRSYLTATVRLAPDEYVDLTDFEYEGANIRSLFRLKVGGQSALYRLQAILKYDPQAGSARCVFARTAAD